MSNTLKTDSQDVEAIAAQLEYCIAPALESPQFKAPGWASDLHHAAGVIRKLERERDSALKSLAELHAALVRYEADVDGEAPSEHHRMMDRAAAILPNAKRIRATD